MKMKFQKNFYVSLTRGNFLHQIPKPIRKILKPVYNLAKSISLNILDYYDLVKGNKNPLVPPRNMIFIGDGDYKKIGNEFFVCFKELGKLMPNHKVLDVGCGIGRMSLPLTKYLSGEGEYYGFDIVEKGITWCNENITSKYPNFHFEHSDIYNKTYNPKGKVRSSKYCFKYKNNFFDFVFLTSVFTHMLTMDVNRYLEEISRVMKTGGRCLITFFLINNESSILIKKGSSSQNLIFQIDENSFAKDNEIPENAIGFKEEFVIKLFKKNNLDIEEIYYGSWCGRNSYKSYQDIMIAQKC